MQPCFTFAGIPQKDCSLFYILLIIQTTHHIGGDITGYVVTINTQETKCMSMVHKIMTLTMCVWPIMLLFKAFKSYSNTGLGYKLHFQTFIRFSISWSLLYCLLGLLSFGGFSSPSLPTFTGGRSTGTGTSWPGGTAARTPTGTAAWWRGGSRPTAGAGGTENQVETQ